MPAFRRRISILAVKVVCLPLAVGQSSDCWKFPITGRLRSFMEQFSTQTRIGRPVAKLHLADFLIPFPVVLDHSRMPILYEAR